MAALGGIVMARNPYVGQCCSGRQVVTLMREINAIEHVLEQTISHLDVMIVIDISGSMQSTIDAVRAQVSALFTQIIGTHDNIRIGVMQQGVDGDTNNASYARRALIRCQPTRDQAAFQTAMNGFPAADGSGEWYINALRLGITGTTWAADARRMILTIGDESAAQWRVGTQHNANATEELTAAIGELNAASIIACIICSNANMWPLCEASYMALANGTGGLYLIAPSTEDIVAMIVSMVTQIVISQTTWYRYTKDGQRQSLGAPDGGVNVPALNAIDNMPFVPLYLRDMRQAVERIVNTRAISNGTGAVYDFAPDGANNLLEAAMGDGTAYGTVPGRRTWRRGLAEMIGTSPYDIDIGETRACVDLLKTAVGIA